MKGQLYNMVKEMQIVNEKHRPSLHGRREKELTGKDAGTPNDCFLLNICSEKQILPRISYNLKTAKNF